MFAVDLPKKMTVEYVMGLELTTKPDIVIAKEIHLTNVVYVEEMELNQDGKIVILHLKKFHLLIQQLKQK